MVAQLLCEIGLVVLMLGSLVSGIQQFGKLILSLKMANHAAINFSYSYDKYAGMYFGNAL